MSRDHLNILPTDEYFLMCCTHADVPWIIYWLSFKSLYETDKGEYHVSIIYCIFCFVIFFNNYICSAKFNFVFIAIFTCVRNF